VGGPVLNLAGQVVGLAVQPKNEPGNYAIGIDSIRPFVDQVVQRQTPYTSGLTVGTLTPQLAAGLRIKYTPGVVVVGVTRGGPGEQAAMQERDVIIEIDGKPVESEERFLRLTVAATASDKEPTVPVSLRVLRGTDYQTVNLTLVAVPA
jgi:serine protease Do